VGQLIVAVIPGTEGLQSGIVDLWIDTARLIDDDIFGLGILRQDRRANNEKQREAAEWCAT
jgi:hypothetical protein